MVVRLQDALRLGSYASSVGRELQRVAAATMEHAGWLAYDAWLAQKGAALVVGNMPPCGAGKDFRRPGDRISFDRLGSRTDKAATAVRLSGSILPQVPSVICPLDLQYVLSVAETIQYPVVLKRAHGAKGRWVRRAANPVALAKEFHELEARGPGVLILQPQVMEFYGRSIRVVITGGRLLAAALRTAVGDEWRSNIAYGATQHPIDLTITERQLAEDTAHAIGLGHAGIDILRSTHGPLVLEVNSYPDFTNMPPCFDEDLTRAVLLACLLA